VISEISGKVLPWLIAETKVSCLHASAHGCVLFSDFKELCVHPWGLPHYALNQSGKQLI